MKDNTKQSERGIIKFFNESKGFGFIKYEGGDIFVHATGLISYPINEGDEVYFTIQEGKRGLQAINVEKE
jgi:CspA family cold shock protein